MLKFITIVKIMLLPTIVLLTSEVVKNLEFPLLSQLDYLQLADTRSIVEEQDSIPPYDDPLY